MEIKAKKGGLNSSQNNMKTILAYCISILPSPFEYRLLEKRASTSTDAGKFLAHPMRQVNIILETSIFPTV